MSTNRSNIQVAAFLILFALLTGLAVAQPVTTIERPAFGVRFDAPAGWVAEVFEEDGGDETVQLAVPGEAGMVVVALGYLTPEDRVEFASGSRAAVLKSWESFVEDMPGVRIDAERMRNVAGIEAGVIDYVGEGVSGSLITAVGPDFGIAFATIAVDGRADEVRAGLETILASFTIGSAGGAAPAGGGNPLAPGSATNPLGPASSNPLAPVSAVASDYLEPFTGTYPQSVLQGILDVGFDGTWTGALTGSAYRLTNDVDPDAVRYYYLMGLPGETGPLAQGTTGVTLGMAPGSDGLTAAGLLFDYDPNDGSYFVFALTTTGYLVMQRSDDGLEVLAMEDLDSIRRDGRNRLELRSVGTSVEVVVNGASAVTLNGTQPFVGGVGIVAVGAGVFEYQDFQYQRP